MEGHGFGLQRVEFDLGEFAFCDFEPPIDTRLALLDFAALQTMEKILSAIAGSHFAQRGPGECFDGVAAQELVPVAVEEIAGSEDVAPSDFAAISDNPSHDGH